MPRSFSTAAICRSDCAPSALIDTIIGTKSAAFAAARPCRALALAMFPLRHTLVMLPRSPPNFVPRALAAARASFVRVLIASASA